MKLLAGQDTVLAGLLLAAAACTPTADAPADAAALGFDATQLATDIRPQDDFFGYVNQRWLDANPIPADWTAYGTTQVVFERTERQVKEIIDNATRNPANPDQAKVGALYTSFMDVDRLEALGITPLDDVLATVDRAHDHKDIIGLFGSLRPLGVQTPIAIYNDTDGDDPERMLAYLAQDGLGLPDRDYFLKGSAELNNARNAYKNHIANLYALIGWPDGDRWATVLFDIEYAIAEVHWSSTASRDRERMYKNKFTLAEANDNTPGIDWNLFLAAASIPLVEPIVLMQDTYFAALGRLLIGVPVPDWQQYLRFKVLKAYARYLDAAIVDENFAFERKALRGQEEQTPRWKRGTRLVNAATGELLGKLYVAKHFPESSKQQMHEMVENLKTAFAQSIDSLDWMSDSTKAAAHAKLARFTPKLGFPDTWRDYDGLDLRSNDLVGNVRRARAFEHAHDMAKLTKPVDRSEWGMSPQTVNAYYRPTFNEVVFPAAILQPPFFDPAADDAVNYGAIGAVIGHEFSHGFDDQGRKFDGDGRLRNWWTDEDATEYIARSASLAAQYAAFQPLPDLAINGELTLGENIGDLAGLIMAHRAYHISLGGNAAPVIDGFSGDARFFIGYARSWRSQSRNERLRAQLLSGPHAPARYRVQGVLPNVPAFYRTFGLKPGDGMYLPPEQRVTIW